MKLPVSFTTPTLISKILTIILFISLPFIGFYYGYNYGVKVSNSPAHVTNNKVLSTKLLSPTSPVSVDTTSDKSTWANYKNNTLGIEFKFPPQLTLVTGTKNKHDDLGDKLETADYQEELLEFGKRTVSGLRYRLNQFKGKCDSEFYDSSQIKEEIVSLDNKPAKLIHRLFAWHEQASLYIDDNGSCISINVTYDDKHSEAWRQQLDKILSTFKFIN